MHPPNDEMSTDDFEAIEKMIYDLSIWDDGVRGAQTPPGQDRMIIAETILRVPESVRERVVKDVIFITIGGAYGSGLAMPHSELKILINFAEMEKDELDKEDMRTTVAHEVAHFILGHEGGGRENEKEADDLIEKWGFKRAYKSYERFAKRRVRSHQSFV